MKGIIRELKKILKRLNQVNKNIWFILILISSAFLYLHNITFSDMWIDESFTYALVQHPINEIAVLISGDYHPPLYFYGLKIFVSIFGVSVFTIRFFSVLGVLSTIVLGYFKGQRFFGKPGALYFCLLIMSLPMLSGYAIEARMYSWGAFTVTGVLLFGASFISSNKKSDLIFLMLFSLAAAYIHYYGLAAAFWANVFVLAFLLLKKNILWRVHLLYSLIAVLFYIPWLFTLLNQVKKVDESFYIAPVSLDTVISCFYSPFASKIWFPPGWELVVIIFGLTLWVLIRNYLIRKDDKKIILSLSLFIFCLTVLSAAIVSLLLQPILYIRYISIISVMLLVPPTLFFITAKNKWLKGIVIAAVLFFGIKVSLDGYSFSYGPYLQSLEHINKKYPDIKKILHVLELTVGPFNEYNKFGFENYWYEPDSTIVYTNMEVFYKLHTTNYIGKVLKKDEKFCVANFPYMPFNTKNLKQILSESQVVRIDTLYDNKIQYGSSLLLYILKYGETNVVRKNNVK